MCFLAENVVCLFELKFCVRSFILRDHEPYFRSTDPDNTLLDFCDFLKTLICARDLTQWILMFSSFIEGIIMGWIWLDGGGGLGTE